MANYEYIISSLPALAPDWKFGEGASFDSYVSWIKSQLGSSDSETVDFLLRGYDEAGLDREFYETALSDRSRFIREFFTFDLHFRNTKARFLNKSVGRPVDSDTLDIDSGEFPEEVKLEGMLATRDLLERERRLDAMTWDKIDELTRFNYFDLDTILGFLARLHIIDRWFRLDEETGRDMFRQLVDELRNTAGEVRYVAPKDE